MLNSRQDLAEYTLRQLGAPVINIEVADIQLEDAIEDAILMYQEYHPDGITRDYFKHTIQPTEIVLNDASLIEPGFTVYTTTGSAAVKRKNNNTLYVERTIGQHFQIGDIVTYTGGSAIVQSVTLGDADNRYIELDPSIVGIHRVMPWQPSYGEGLFDITYQLRMNDLRNLAGGTMNYFVSSMEYLSMLDFFLRREKQFRFNRRQNRIYLDVDWKQLPMDSWLVVECYRAIDDSTFGNMFNDPWLKRYATAKVKRQWGANLSKHSDISLPGGVTLNGKAILAEAVDEIRQLEEDLINNMAPLDMLLG